MTDKQFRLLRGEVMFWAFVILANLCDGWRSVAALVGLLAVYVHLWRLERAESAGPGFWAKVWNR